MKIKIYHKFSNMILCIHAETYFILCWLFLVRNKLCFQNSIWRMFWKRNQKRKEKKRGESLPGIWPSFPLLPLCVRPSRAQPARARLPFSTDSQRHSPLFLSLICGAHAAAPSPSFPFLLRRDRVGYENTGSQSLISREFIARQGTQ